MKMLHSGTAVSLLVIAAAEHPLLQLGHPSHRRRKLQTATGNLDGADCGTGTIPQDLIRLENQLDTGNCIEDWMQGTEDGDTNTTGGNWYFYPNDFEGILNSVEHYICPIADAEDANVITNTRIIYSNGFPDHSVRWGNPNTPCEKFWYIEMPAEPVYRADVTIEPPSGGIVAIALNGVPIYGAQEAQPEVGNALEPDVDSESAVFDARFWYGHSTAAHVAHYHNPAAGVDFVPSSETLLGYALDGFPLYGPVDDDSILDECNGRMVNDKYQYHVRTLEQVDESLPYCPDGVENLSKPYINWNYIVGCYHGDANLTSITILNATQRAEFSFPTEEPFSYTGCTKVKSTSEEQAMEDTKEETRPHVIIIQPDDLPFFDIWDAPPNAPSLLDTITSIGYTLPNMERLRTQGVQLRQAYAASPACGTSRFSTLTGKYPSRAGSSREGIQRTIGKVTIPTTKLTDVEGYGMDCSVENLAVAMKDAGYRTGVVGKWHLFPVDESTYTYEGLQEDIRNCGFDFAEAIYAENLSSDLLNSAFHNMEWVTAKAIDFIKDSTTDDPFLLYFNPTVPHSGGNVFSALFDSTCRDTPGGDYDTDFLIKGMSLEYGSCAAYRDFVGERAGAQNSPLDETNAQQLQELGAIWLDDAVGALFHALADKGIFDNTLIIFQMDHGLEAKNTLFENGIRIAQFVHYPKELGTGGGGSEALVSTIDVAPTIMGFAGFAQLPYEMDGRSWHQALTTDSASAVEREAQYFEKDRCLWFEYQRDRSVRCGCLKLVRLVGARDYFTQNISVSANDDSLTTISGTLGMGLSLGYLEETVTQDKDSINFVYNLCDDSDTYITFADQTLSAEAIDLVLLENATSFEIAQLRDAGDCFTSITDSSTPDPEFGEDCSSVIEPSCVTDADCALDSFTRTVCSLPRGRCVELTAPEASEGGGEPGGLPGPEASEGGGESGGLLDRSRWAWIGGGLVLALIIGGGIVLYCARKPAPTVNERDLV